MQVDETRKVTWEGNIAVGSTEKLITLFFVERDSNLLERRKNFSDFSLNLREG